VCALALVDPLRAQTPAQPSPTAAVPQATTPAQPAEPGSNLTVYLLTFGWGDVVWERFGHNAIWIKDRAAGTDMTYNWGMFDFNQPHFIWRFVTGDTVLDGADRLRVDGALLPGAQSVHSGAGAQSFA
jgi:hypothetical protein